MADKPYILFQLKMDRALHSRLRKKAFNNNISIHKLLLRLVTEEVADIPELPRIIEGQATLDGF